MLNLPILAFFLSLWISCVCAHLIPDLLGRTAPHCERWESLFFTPCPRACTIAGGEPRVRGEHGGHPRVDAARGGGGKLPLRQDHAFGLARGSNPSRGLGPQQRHPVRKKASKLENRTA